ncbi:sulfatase-like hydrolase/transferase [Butyrivibrio sp. AE3006]|uniref:sulfatase-like hydrolase/transferase n=1 Tax=Butyrivibrio sp. AE3006 TaxID=1280673 RepID=UPI0004162BFD|nr:sulfatase-like hydrolase/transferase [Butyrivibrio sp. AE3006]
MKNQKLTVIFKCLGWICLIFLTLMGFSMHWMLVTWSDLTFEEVLFQLSAIQGTGNGMITQYIVNNVVPVVVIFSIVFILRFIVFKKDTRKKSLVRAVSVFGIGLFLFYFTSSAIKLDLFAYIKGQLFPGTFIEDNYVDPQSVNIDFPEKKRNLIYIYMESGETTFADKENGGAFDENVIPELTALAQENEDFSGADKTLNGGLSLYGTTWTMGGIFAESSGLPLKTDVGKNKMSTMESFAPELITIGDILDDHGYNQVYMIGSPAIFGGRDLFFKDHGNFEIKDYYYMQDNGIIPEDYYVFWGFEDKKLFSFAKDELTELSKKDEPFNLTLLTVDTHFEDGYVCDLCENKFDEQYSNVYACSSKQITEFVDWVKQQDFYENTTIVISGDHPTMDQNYCTNVDSSYSRKVYTTFINAAATPEKNERREYSTFDAFPTTIAAIGATIEGNRLGLGTNLFSSEETLLEKYGESSLNSFLKQRSEFLSKLMDTDTVEYKDYTYLHNATVDVQKSDEGKFSITVRDILEIGEGIDKIDLCITPDGSEKETVYPMVYDGFTTYEALVDSLSIPGNYGHIRVEVTGLSGEKYNVYETDTDIYLLSEDYISYLKKLREYLDEGRDITILTSAMKDATLNFTAPMGKAMNDLGFETDFLNLNKQSYYGILDQESVTEHLSRDYLTYTGSFSDGTTYKVNSGGKFAGNTSHLIIGDTDYSNRTPGFNYLVYDNTSSRMISNASYGTYYHPLDVDLKMTSYDAVNNLITVEASNVRGIRKWEQDNKSVIKYFDPKDQSTLDFSVLGLNDENKTLSATFEYSASLNDQIQLQLNVAGSRGKVRTTESITSLEFLQYSDVNEYLSYIGKRDDIAILLAVNTFGALYPHAGSFEDLKTLGLGSQGDLNVENLRCGYVAVIDDGKIVTDKLQNQQSEDYAEDSGTLSNGTEYSIKSTGYDIGSGTSICLNGTDYSLNRVGLNVVIYDLNRNEVVDTAVIKWVDSYMVSR